jgi:hypothetical protein
LDPVYQVTNFGVGFSLLPWNMFAVNGASQEFTTSSFPPDSSESGKNEERRIEEGHGGSG